MYYCRFNTFLYLQFRSIFYKTFLIAIVKKVFIYYNIVIIIALERNAIQLQNQTIISHKLIKEC